MGRALIKERLHGKKVLVCLDDVWERTITAQAVVTKGDLGPGSCILKTSRARDAIDGIVHDLDVLDRAPAWELFCWHAFNGDKPLSALAEQAEKALGKCGGLPLAIKLLGGELAGVEDKGKWLEEFLILETDAEPMMSRLEVIKRSFTNLPSQSLKDAFALLAMWPSTYEFRLQRGAVQNLGAAVFGDKPLKKRQPLAKMAVEMLASRSLIQLESDKNSLEKGEVRITIHDLLVDVAMNLINEGDWTTRRFFRWVPGDVEPKPFKSAAWNHLSISLGKIPINSLTRHNSSIISLVVVSGAGLLQCNNKDQNVSQCKLLSIRQCSTVATPQLQLQSLVHLQCLRLFQCEGMVSLMELGSIKTLNVLEVSSCKGEQEQRMLAKVESCLENALFAFQLSDGILDWCCLNNLGPFRKVTVLCCGLGRT
jgi:hypothetical protein